MHTIETKDLCKRIHTTMILNHISVKMESGKIYGLVGRNGSGKTMLFRSLAGLIRPTQGEILIDNKRLYKEISAVPNLGLILENAGLYPEFTGFQNLKLLAKINHKITENQIRNAIQAVGLDASDKRTVKKYSLGMRQRIVLAQAIMEEPDFLLLDEPMNALDESGVELIRGILKNHAKRGALVVLASHNKEDIDVLCDIKYKMQQGYLEEYI